MKKKKIIISVTTFLILFILWFSFQENINNYKANKSTLTSKIEKIIPSSIIALLKKTRVLFISKSEEFSFNLTASKNKIDNSDYLLTKFSNSDLIPLGPRSYIGKFEDNLLIMTGTGTLIYSPIKSLEGEKILFKTIKTNFSKLVGVDFISEERIITRSILIKKKKIYVSYIKKVNKKCYMNSIFSADLNLKNIKFSEVFNTGECYPFFGNQDGGYLSDYKENEILLSIGDWDWETRGVTDPQKKDNLKGKIISINLATKDYKVKAMGFRNPQGLFYDKKDNIIYSSDHGPQGGDEININKNPDESLFKNYGWPISSYGEHYGFSEDKALEEYKRAPLHKSHKKYGFLEPLKYFVPSIAPSQILKAKGFDAGEDNVIYLAAMGYDIEEGDLSVHKFTLNEDHQIEDHLILPIGERVRDMFYIEKLNKIALFLESSGSLGFLEKAN